MWVNQSVTYVTDWTNAAENMVPRNAEKNRRFLYLRASRGNMAFLRFAEKSFFFAALRGLCVLSTSVCALRASALMKV